MNNCGIDGETQSEVCRVIASIGYSKRLSGKQPEKLKGKIVSDSDICDAIGANGILRVQKYSTKHGATFFDRNISTVENNRGISSPPLWRSKCT